MNLWAVYYCGLKKRLQALLFLQNRSRKDDTPAQYLFLRHTGRLLEAISKIGF
jgi:hypothetical protein